VNRLRARSAQCTLRSCSQYVADHFASKGQAVFNSFKIFNSFRSAFHRLMSCQTFRNRQGTFCFACSVLHLLPAWFFMQSSQKLASNLVTTVQSRILIIKSNEIHNFSDLSDKILYIFRTGPLSIIRSISTLYTRNMCLSC